jgi:hypothetical protein
MNEDTYGFNAELDGFLAMDRTSAEALEFWHLIEVRYPELLADWLARNPDFAPPHERGIRIGKRMDHLQGGRRNR